MTSDKQLAIFKPSEILQRNDDGFDALTADRSGKKAYACMEMPVKWPKGMRREAIMDYQKQVAESADMLTKAFDYAINGLRQPQEQFTVKASVSHGPDSKPETNFSIFVDEHSGLASSKTSEAPETPESMVKFLTENQQQIARRLKEYLSQNQPQEI